MNKPKPSKNEDFCVLRGYTEMFLPNVELHNINSQTRLKLALAMDANGVNVWNCVMVIIGSYTNIPDDDDDLLVKMIVHYAMSDRKEPPPEKFYRWVRILSM